MNSPKRLRMPLLSFFAGIILVSLAFQFSSTRALIDLAKVDGYAAAILAGILYSPSVTSPFSTAMFFSSNGALNPFAVALIGGCGAMLYDMTLFLLIRNDVRPRCSTRLRAWWTKQKRLVPLFWIAGMVVLASPLPDELASVFLGMVAMPARVFLLFSLVMNAIGIFTIVSLGR